MANTIAEFGPYDAEFLSTNFPQLQTIHSTERVPVLSFDTTTEESACWTYELRAGSSGSLAVKLRLVMASATSGNVAFHIAIAKLTGAVLGTTITYDTVNTTATTAVPGTLVEFNISLTLTNIASIVAGDLFRLKVTRDTGVASNAAGDCHLVKVVMSDGN